MKELIKPIECSDCHTLRFLPQKPPSAQATSAFFLARLKRNKQVPYKEFSLPIPDDGRDPGAAILLYGGSGLAFGSWPRQSRSGQPPIGSCRAGSETLYARRSRGSEVLFTTRGRAERPSDSHENLRDHSDGNPSQVRGEARIPHGEGRGQ